MPQNPEKPFLKKNNMPWIPGMSLPTGDGVSGFGACHTLQRMVCPRFRTSHTLQSIACPRFRVIISPTGNIVPEFYQVIPSREWRAGVSGQYKPGKECYLLMRVRGIGSTEKHPALLAHLAPR